MPSSKRLNQLQKSLKVGGLVIDDPLSIFYLLGLNLSLGRLLITHDSATLFVDGRYIDVCRGNSPCSVAPREAFAETAQGLSELAFDKERTRFSEFQMLEKLGIPLRPIKSPVDKMRQVKDSDEIKALSKSAHLLYGGYEFILDILQEGMSERDVALAFHFEMLKRGAEGLSFDPIIAFGKNSAYPHYHPSDCRLKKGECVLIDIGVMVDNYASDMTRTHLFGAESKELETLYETTLFAAKEAIALCKPGVKLGQLDEAARRVMRAKGLEKHFLHTLGHGIGLEVHENFRISATGIDKDLPLQEGMVFTIEPGIYIEGIGGVRHEEMVLITGSGHKILTQKQ